MAPLTHSFSLGGLTVGHHNLLAPTTSKEISTTKEGLHSLVAMLKEAGAILHVDPSINSTDNNSLEEVYAEMMDSFDVEEGAKLWFNNKLWASLPINLNTYHNALLQSLIRANSSGQVAQPKTPPPRIATSSHPMNESLKEALDSDSMERAMVFRVVLIQLVLCVIPASFAMFLVEERISFSKQLQLIYGVPPSLYQLINLIYDLVFYSACALTIIAIYAAIGLTFFTFSWAAITATTLILLLYGSCCLPLVYLLQRFFAVPPLAFGMISGLLFFVGTVSTMTVLMLENLQTDQDEGLRIAKDICSVVFMILPQYNMGMSIFRLTFLDKIQQIGRTYLENIGRLELAPQLPIPDPLEWELVGKHCVALVSLSMLLLVLLIIAESHYHLTRLERMRTARILLRGSNGKRAKLDVDVLAEQESVAALVDYDQYGLVVKSLCKAYQAERLVVNNLSFAVQKGECFGLLGVNGAGKSTAFKMLTGSLSMGLGEIYINGTQRTRRAVGYCPQFDALSPKMTAYEHLAFYSRIRQVNAQHIGKVCDWALRNLNLLPYAHETTDSFSGGNKRKLSAALALVGDPPLVLMDEPSAGMDAGSQLFMWSLIRRLRGSNRTVVLTSHSMEECECLCTRLAIMVDGQFQCIGTTQHLKERFGEGYTLTMKLASAEQVDPAHTFIQTNVPSAVLNSRHCSTLFYRIPPSPSTDTLSKCLRAIMKMEGEGLKMEDFTLSQTTLDDVFLSFASTGSSGSGGVVVAHPKNSDA